MRVILLLLAGLSFLAGAGVIGGAENAIHDIEGLMLFLISAVFISGAAIVESIIITRRKIQDAFEETSLVAKKVAPIVDKMPPAPKPKKLQSKMPLAPSQNPVTSPSEKTIPCPLCSHPIGRSLINLGRNICPKCKGEFEANT